MNHKLPTVIFFWMTILAADACQPDTVDDQEGLQALLHDEPLTLVSPAAVVSVAGEAGAANAIAIHSNIILSSANPIGVWNLDDCNLSWTNLSDATFNNNTAFRSVGVTCTEGIQNTSAAAIAAAGDIVYVPDQPDFTFESGVTVAGWFKPAAIGGTRTLFRKRDKTTSSFALMLNAARFEFVVNIGEGHAISVIAPKKAKAGIFQHVAGTYDGTTARLYVDGHEVNNFSVSGAIPLGPGPLLMGNDGSERRFSGAIDNTLFATHALTADEILALTCFPQSPSMVVTPTDPTTPPGVKAAIDIALTNHNAAACAPITFVLQESNDSDGHFTVDPPAHTSVQSAPVPSGTTGHMTITATSEDSVEPGTSWHMDFIAIDTVYGFDNRGDVNVTVSEPSGCHVNTARELMITSTSVVDDPLRTVFDPTSQDSRNGVWTFKHLVENMAPTPADAPAMVEAMLNSFTSPQTVNGFVLAARPSIRFWVLDHWPRTADGALDLARAPLRLQAIVNRFDLRDLSRGDAGEGRFVFGFYDFSSLSPLEATVMFEYKLPAGTDDDVLAWAQSFHGLGAMQLGESYNAALQAITEGFVKRGARPAHPNGSAINAVTTNENGFGPDGWELRAFHLSPSSGQLEPAPLALTPDRNFSFSTTLTSYINANEAAIIADQHTVPEEFNGHPFQAGSVLNSGTWFTDGVNNDARHHFALNTCNGCHSFPETGTSFLHINPRLPGGEASLSQFLTGVTMHDPVTGQARRFNDLSRRIADLRAVVCADSPLQSGAIRTALRKGIQRVH